jgi:DNA-binding MarR family transcriptional regulator
VGGADESGPAAREPALGGSLSWALRQVLLANREAEHALAQHLGLGLNDVAAMEHLLGTPQGLGPADIAQRLRIRSASATVLIDRLEEAGHVTRAAHHSDRRRTVVRPTARAREEIIDALRPLVAAVDQAAAELDEAEQAVVLRFLDAAAARIRGAAEDLEPTGG